MTLPSIEESEEAVLCGGTELPWFLPLRVVHIFIFTPGTYQVGVVGVLIHLYICHALLYIIYVSWFGDTYIHALLYII